MLDSRYLRKNIQEVAKRLAIKGFELDQSFIEDKENKRKKVQIETEELILATNSTLEGETTSHFIYDNLKNETHLKITKLARGVPLGGELEYVDRGTIMHALSGRQRLKEEGE